MNIIKGIGSCVGYVFGGVGSFCNRVAEYCCPTKSKPTNRVQTAEDVIHLAMMERHRNISIPTSSEWRLTQSLGDLEEYIHNAYVVITGTDATVEEKRKEIVGLADLLQHKDCNVGIKVISSLIPALDEIKLDPITANALVDSLTKYIDNYGESLDSLFTGGHREILGEVLRLIKVLVRNEEISDTAIMNLFRTLRTKFKNTVYGDTDDVKSVQMIVLRKALVIASREQEPKKDK